MTRIRRIFQENRRVREALCMAGLVLYAFLFSVIAYSDNSMLVAKSISDGLMMRGIDRSEEIVVVAVTPEDTDRYRMDAGELAAMAVEKMNSSGNTRPAVIGFEFPESRMEERGEAILQAIPYKKNLILPVELTVPENAVIRAPLSSELPSDLRANRYPEEIRGEAMEAHTVRLTGEDGILRHMSFDLTTADGASVPSMAQLAYMRYHESLGQEAPLPEGAENFSVIIKYSDQSAGSYTLRVSDLLEGTFPAEKLAGKIVFIGSYDSALDEGYRPAIDHSLRMHSAQVDAEITNGLLMDNTAFSVSVWMQAVVLCLCVIGLVVFVTKSKTFYGGVCFCLIYELLSQVVTMLLFGIGYGILSFPHMANGLINGALFLGITAFVRSTRNRSELEKVLGKYVDNHVVGGILNREGGAEKLSGDSLQGHTRKVAVLFSDIREFTAISEKVSGERLVRMLNDYLSMMTSCVERYGGTVDKYIGDCVMAYWGAPEEDEDPVYHACLAAAEIQRRAEEASAKMNSVIGRNVRIGIGISYGDVIVGNIGSAEHMSFTVIGDVVNVASRLQGIAPGGEIYLSEPAAKMLRDNTELEKLPREIQLKGKEKASEVYAVRNISVRGGRRKKKEEIQVRNMYRRRGLTAVGVNFLMFFIQFTYVINALRNLGIGFMAYPTVPLAALSCVVSLMLIPFDLKGVELADGTNVRPRWVNVAMLAGFIANMQIGITFFADLISHRFMGLPLTDWPAGITTYLAFMLLSVLSFLVFEIHPGYGWKEVLKAEIPLAGILLAGQLIMNRTGLSAKMPQLYDSYYRFPAPLVTLALEIIGLFAAAFVSGWLHRKERLRLPEDLGLAALLRRYRMSGWYQFITGDKSRQIVWIFLNALIGILNLKVTVTAFLAGGIRVYSNPSLIGIVVGLSALLSMGILLSQVARGEPIGRTPLYRTVSFLRNLGCTVDFFSVFLLAVSGEGIGAFFVPRWSADGWVFVFCPLVSMVMWLSERNDYRLMTCMACALPYAAMPLLSRAAIESRNLAGMYDFEIANYYSPTAICASILGEFFVAGLLYLANILVSRALREAEREDRQIMLSVCGSRYGITGGKKTESEFGLHSECYVLTEGDYGIVIGGGSGMEKAAEKLNGCTSVDVIIGSADFRTMMGFLMAPNICPGARVRIVSPFGAERFAVNPFWPVNLIRKNCVTVPAGKPFRLNDMYSVLFTPTDPEGQNYMIRLEGETVICCTGHHPSPEEAIRKWCMNADLLIYNAAESWSRGCYIAIDNNIPELLLSGAPIAESDEELLKKEQSSRRLFSEVYVAREGTGFPVRRCS